MPMNASLPSPDEITLMPGDFHFGSGHTRISTLLGSCVAITMWHPTFRIGGMCHYLLAGRGCSNRLSKGHYADEAIALFMHEIFKAGTWPRDYEVKVFGGGNMFSKLPAMSGSVNVAKNNIESGQRLLADNGFRIKASDVGGTQHRRVILDVWSGDVWLSNG
jgi:chemotaxis protein CheD